MFKFFGGVMVGVFLGALAVEILNKRYPEMIEKVEEKSRRAADYVNDFARRSATADYVDDFAQRGATAERPEAY